MIKRIQYHHHSSHCEKQYNRTYVKSYLAGETVLDIYTYDGLLQIPSNKNKELGFPSLDVHNLLLNRLSATWHLNPSYTNYRWKLSCANHCDYISSQQTVVNTKERKEKKKYLVCNGQLTGLKINRGQEFDSCTWQVEENKFCSESTLMQTHPCLSHHVHTTCTKMVVYVKDPPPFADMKRLNASGMEAHRQCITAE